MTDANKLAQLRESFSAFSKPPSIEEAEIFLRDLVQFAYDNGYHENGYDPVNVLLLAISEAKVSMNKEKEKEIPNETTDKLAHLCIKPHAANWPEDYNHENGCYENTCYGCGRAFYGYKNRPKCRICYTTLKYRKMLSGLSRDKATDYGNIDWIVRGVTSGGDTHCVSVGSIESGLVVMEDWIMHGDTEVAMAPLHWNAAIDWKTYE